MNVVLDGFTFLLTRDDGRMAASDGLYHRDTRHLSKLDVGFEHTDVRPLHHEVRSQCHHSHYHVTASPTVNQLAGAGDQRPSDLVLARDRVVGEGDGLHERITVTDHSASRHTAALRIGFDAARRDRDVDARVHDRTVVYRYTYRDADGDPVEPTCGVGLSEQPAAMDAGSATVRITVDPQESTSVSLAARPGADGPLEVGSETVTAARRAAEPPFDPRVRADRSVRDRPGAL